MIFNSILRSQNTDLIELARNLKTNFSKKNIFDFYLYYFVEMSSDNDIDFDLMVRVINYLQDSLGDNHFTDILKTKSFVPFAFFYKKYLGHIDDIKYLKKTRLNERQLSSFLNEIIKQEVDVDKKRALLELKNDFYHASLSQ